MWEKPADFSGTASSDVKDDTAAGDAGDDSAGAVVTHASEAAEPQQSVTESRREQLVEFYKQHDPSKVDIVDALLANPFEDLFNALMDKYGEVPEAWLASTAELQPRDPVAEEQTDSQSRLSRGGATAKKRVRQMATQRWFRRHV